MVLSKKKIAAVSLHVAVVCLFGALTCGGTLQRMADAADRVVLDNGLTVLLYPVPGADQVAVESFYRVGLLQEPKGMSQVSHLVEHLFCLAATKSYEAGASMRLLNQKGSANGETLPDFTHFDYILPASELELALRVEAERLSSLKITQEVIRQEATMCYREANMVEQQPQAGMLKYAFMAFNQAWRYGVSKVRVRGGLEEIPVADLEQFYRTFYHPKNAVLVLVGGFERDEALNLVKKHLGSVRAPATAPPQPVPWAKVPKDMTVQWDSKLRAVCLAFPPPDDIKERLALSFWGKLLWGKLMTDEQLQQAADSVYCTDIFWSVEMLPFFVYATAKPNVSVQQLQSLLMARLQSVIAEKPSGVEVAQLRSMAADFAQTPELKWDDIRRQAQQLALQFGQQATGIVMGNLAIQLGWREILLGADVARLIQALQSISSDDLHHLLKRTLNPSKQFVTILIPIER